jgi:glycosyltransferase involved in cell wall biosynthesis
MAERPSVSVVMATYNGAAYVEEQIASILEQLHPADELVVVDDASSDTTADVVAAIDDPRIRLVRSPDNRGYVRTFEAAIRASSGEAVLLADQDDVWLPRHVEVLAEALRHHRVAASNLRVLGTGAGLQGPSGKTGWELRARDQDRTVVNLDGVLAGIRPYYGCAMAVRRDALDAALPFPAWLTESHDLWLATYGILAGSIAHVEEPTVLRRLHADNQTPVRPRGVVPALRSRLMLVRAVVELRRRISRRR